MKLGPSGEFKQELYTAKKPEDDSFRAQENIQEKMRDVMKTFSGRILGSGSECIVAETEKDGFILAVHHAKIDSSITKKELFYAHKILSTLFPKNFPKVYASFIVGPEGLDGIQGTVRQKIIENDSKENGLSVKNKETNRSSIKDFFIGVLEQFFPKTELEKNFNQIAQVQKMLQRLGITLLVDGNKNNFIEDKDGNQYYVDTASKFYVQKSCRAKLEKFLDQEKYSAAEKRVVLGSLDRLSGLVLESVTNGVSNKNPRVRVF